MAVTKFGLLTLLAVGTAQVSGRRQIQTPAQSPVLNEMTSQGCFSTLPSDAESHGSGAFLTSGACWNSCTKENKNVAITSGSTCYCSDNYPAKSSLLDDSSCDWPCPGYAMEACGGLDPKAYSIFNTGLELAPEYDDGEANDDDASSATEAPSSASATISTASVASTKITVTSSATGIPSTTETEEASSATASLEETSPVLPVTASQIAPVVNEQTAAATPSASASTVAENASPTLSNPIGNIVRMMMSLL